jgi:ADP-glucose pyrophosphorylase
MRHDVALRRPIVLSSLYPLVTVLHPFDERWDVLLMLQILPGACADMHLQAHLFDDYWEDIGTIASFFEANLALAKNPPQFEFYDGELPD